MAIGSLPTDEHGSSRRSGHEIVLFSAQQFFSLQRRKETFVWLSVFLFLLKIVEQQNNISFLPFLFHVLVYGNDKKIFSSSDCTCHSCWQDCGDIRSGIDRDYAGPKINKFGRKRILLHVSSTIVTESYAFLSPIYTIFPASISHALVHPASSFVY